MVGVDNLGCDFYFGSHSGDKLLEDLRAAKTDITIISPYIDTEALDTVVNTVREEVPIFLITHLNLHEINDQVKSYKWKKLIQQRKLVNEDKLRLFKKLTLINQALVFFSVLFLVSLIFNGSTLLKIPISFYLSLIGIFFLGAVIIKKFKSKIVVFTYEYLSLVHLTLLPDPYDCQNFSYPFVHAKIFIIDKSILHAGSLNFTRAGMNSNIETRIRINDKNKVAKIHEELISYKNKLNAYHLEEICKHLYQEPIN